MSGSLYDNGIAVEQDLSEAIKYYLESIDKGKEVLVDKKKGIIKMKKKEEEKKNGKE